ncbi:MAG: autotransporter assembly complex protein TamA [Sphingobium phenoxybenzoativorans]
MRIIDAGLGTCIAVAMAGQACPVRAQDAPPQNGASSPAVDETPIIPNDSFEQRLPPISDGQDTPLPSVDEFMDKAAADTPPASTLPPETAPPEDMELTRPLAPLDGFEVTPVEVAADPTPDAPDAIAYTTAIEGFKGTGLEDEFNELSALRKGKGKADTAAMVQARAREDEALAIRLLHSAGYFDASALSTVDQSKAPSAAASSAQNAPLNAIVTVTPGKQYVLGEIVVQAQATVPPDLIRKSLPLKSGDTITTERIEGAEANVSLQLPRQGYPFVKLGNRDIALDGQTLTGDYTLPVDTGPRSSFGGITTSGDLAFDAEHIGVLARFDRGELYDSRKVDDLRKALVATSLFSSVSVEPKPTGQPGPDGTEYVELQVEQDAGPARTLAGEAGYGTGQGFRAQGSWTHRNLFPPEGALILTGVGGTQEQGIGATFRRANAGKRDRTVQAGINLSHQNYASYEAFTAGISGSISRASTPIFQKRWTWSYGFEILGSNETTLNETTGETRRLTYLIGALPGQIGYDRSDDLLNPTRGYRATLRVSPEASLQGSVSPYVRAMFDLSGYYPVSESIVIAARTRVGTITGVSRADIAPSRRIYAGGGGSVRGFGYQELGPKDANNDPIGGRSVNEFALEARYRFGNFGIVPFVDAGQVYDSSMPKFSDIRFGAGIGGRFYTNFGPFRADIAMPINRQPGESKFALYIGIGQAF